MYVYQITNVINNKSYIGITNDYKKRWSNHRTVYNNKSSKEYDKPLYRAFRKYGIDNFTFKVLKEGLSLDQANLIEQELIQSLHTLTTENGYNVTKGGEGTKGISKYGANNNNACLTQDEAQYILDHRDQPEYVLYEQFAEKISYSAFKDIYLSKTYTNLSTSTPIYPFNLEFSSQFTSSNKLTYNEVVELREMYAQGIDWKIPYEQKYKELYPNPMVFWGIYVGNKYKLVMPEVFSKEQKHKFASDRHSGEKNGRAKISEKDVRTIRKMSADGASNAEIYKLYPQVTPTSIRNIITRKTWKNVID